MKKSKKTKKGLRLLLILLAIVAIAAYGIYYYYLQTPLSNVEETQYVYIDRDDNIDSVYTP